MLKHRIAFTSSLFFLLVTFSPYFHYSKARNIWGYVHLLSEATWSNEETKVLNGNTTKVVALNSDVNSSNTAIAA